jgi:DNA-binding MarR family transcriptional regulator
MGLLKAPSPAIVRSPDDLASIVLFPDELTRFVRRPDDRAGDTLTRMDDSTAKPTPAPSGAKTRTRQPPFQRRLIAEQDLIYEIDRAARAIADARDLAGRPVYRTDPVWRVLSTVAHSDYCLAIADLGRAMRVRKQAAHELAHAAVRAGVVDLEPNPQDKRILQLLLTPYGRSQLAAADSAERLWLATVLNGLGDRELAATTHVVRVIRQRLERAAREWAQLQKGERTMR